MKTWIIGALLAVSTLAAGCAAVRFTYGQAPGLTFWWLDRYVDFNEAQSAQVRQGLGDWFRWHRATQLPGYTRFLDELQAQVLGPLTPAQVCGWHAEAMGRLSPLLDQALPVAASAVRTLSVQQVAHIESRYAKVNQDFRRDYLQADPAERAKKALQRAVDRAEMFYGKLDAAQRELLAGGLAASPFDPVLWLEERMQRQQETVVSLRGLVESGAPAEETRAVLRTLVRHAQQSPRPGYVAYQKRLHEHNCQLTAKLHSTTTREQRLVANQKLKGWAEDARVLAAEAGG